MYKICYVDTVIQPQYKYVEVETMAEVREWFAKNDIMIVGWKEIKSEKEVVI